MLAEDPPNLGGVIFDVREKDFSGRHSNLNKRTHYRLHHTNISPFASLIHPIILDPAITYAGPQLLCCCYVTVKRTMT